MDEKTAQTLGRRLLARRKELKLSTLAVAERAGMPQPTYSRIENGQFAEPRAEKLAAIAVALELPPTEVLGMAGYEPLASLPDFRPYMRQKFKDLPQADVEAIERYAEKLLRKHGMALDGPEPGEDEA